MFLQTLFLQKVYLEILGTYLERFAFAILTFEHNMNLKFQLRIHGEIRCNSLLQQ